MNKIPSTCLSCKNTLSSYDMDAYLKTCEACNKDPMEAARKDPPGILCLKCLLTSLSEASADSDEGKIFKKISNRAKFLNKELKVINGGKTGQ